MNTAVRKNGDITIIDMSGNIKSPADLDNFSQAIDSEIGHENTKILLNFKDVSFINSSGLGRLILASKKIAEISGTLQVANLSDDLEELFTFTRLKDKVAVYKNEAEALEALAGP
ncbi:MAG: STAS domain-containing protein [Nitrospinota bacterium]